MAKDIKDYIAMASNAPLSRAQAEAAFNLLMSGHTTHSQIAGLLMAMRTRGESVDEFAAAAAVLRKKCIGVRAPKNAMDIVGTGGDGKGTLNISTATAFVVAGCNVPVAKHGNRNLSSQSGAADVLGALGINVMAEPETAEKAINQVGIGFMMAPMHHPAMKHVMPVRQELGTRTIFNILGPLTNPAQVKYQLTGTFSPELVVPMAKTLGELGCRKAWIVHGDDGTDEISIAGKSRVAELSNGTVSETEIHPEDAGLAVHPFASIKGGDPQYNAQAITKLLAGEMFPYRDAVLLNAAAALVVVGRAVHLKDGVEMAREAIDSGRARQKLDDLVVCTN